MDDRYVLMVEEYIRENLPHPDIAEEPYIFELHTYSRWAAYEILDRLMGETMKLPSHVSGMEQRTAEEIIEDFIDEMDYYSVLGSDAEVNEIFYIAQSEAKCILMYICSHQ